MSDTDLGALIESAAAERIRRWTLANGSAEAEALAARYMSARGDQPGDQWIAPTAAHDAYPQGWQVTHNGKTWEALAPACVWEPGVSGWREIVTESAAPPEWVAPTGAHDAYQIGDRVTFGGKVYESKIAANVWSPTAYPAGWTLIPA